MTITALDRVTLDVTDLAAAKADYAALLGRAAEGDRFTLGNMELHLVAAAEPGLAGVGFATDDLAKTHRLLTQRALAPAPIEAGQATLSRERTHGTPIALVEASPRAPAPPEPGAIAGLDHLVIGTPDPERAIVLYAGRLGLDLRLDRSNPDWGVRLLFFRCGDLVIEVAHRLGKGIGDGPDRFMGLSWRAADLAATHARLAAAGFNVSEPRTGRRPGTRVFTVRDRTAGVPTIVLGPE
jgi:catechol 2,3-dioxygenase-like lactoylglutathione lyase family enzyme